MNKKTLIILIMLFLLAIFLRLFLLRYHNIIEEDGLLFTSVAKNLFSGQGYLDLEGKVSVAVGALYPILIGLFSFFIKNIELAGRFVSIIFGSILFVPIYLLTKKIYNKKVALIAALLIVIYPVLSYLSLIVYSDIIFYFFISLGAYVGLLAIKKRKYFLYFLTGIIFGLSYLTRFEGGGYLFFIYLFAIFYPKFKFKKAFYILILFLIGFLIIASPYLIFLYNYTGHLSISAKSDFSEVYMLEPYTEEYEQAHFLLNEDNTEIIQDRLRKPKEGTIKKILKNPLKSIRTYIENLYEENNQFVDIFPIIFIILASFGLFRSNFKYGLFKQLYLLIFILYPLLLYPVFFILARFLACTIPFLIIWVSKGIYEFGISFNKKGFKNMMLWFVIIICIFGIILTIYHPQYGIEQEALEHKEAGIWLKENIGEDLIIMSRKQWVSFYSNSKVVFVPYSNYEDMLDFACHENVDYIVIDERFVSKTRPRLRFLLDEKNTPKEIKSIYKDESIKKILIYELKKRFC